MEVCIADDDDPGTPVTPTSTTLPPTLSGALDTILEGRSRKDLQERARRLSEGFRARKASQETIRDEADALAYAATRLPATYAATVTVLARLRDEAPWLAPARILDIGCGLGTASHAALAVWPGIEAVTMLDHSAPFLALARQLAAASGCAALEAASIVSADMALGSGELEGPFDLVVASYALTEIPEARLGDILDRVWRRVDGALALVEPGTPRDHKRLMALRARLTSGGAHIASPCPHDRACPLEEPDWCHFAARLSRSRDHKFLKDAETPFEDEKFSYLVAVKREPQRGFARILRPPRALKYGIVQKLCGASGIGETTTLKRDKPRYEPLRKTVWGDRIDAP